MLAPYRSILTHPGAKAFAFAGLLSRLPMSMFNISFILMVQIQYDSYEMAGRVAAIGIVVWALQTVPTSRLVDRIGQRRAMLPLLALHVTGATVGILVAVNQGAEWLLWIAVAVASLSGPLGSLTRARWSNILDSDEDIHTAFALEGVLDEVLFIGGPALATILATAVWAPAGLVVSTVGTVIGLLILLSLTATEPPARGSAGGAGLGLKIPPAVIGATFIALGLGTMFGAFDISVVGFAEEQGHKTLSGVLLGIVSAGSFAGGLLYGARHWRMELWKRTVIGTVVLALGFGILTLAEGMIVFAIIGFFAGAAIAPTLTNADTIVQRVVKRDQITEGMSWLRIGMGVGVALGAWIAGYLVDNVGAHAGLYTSAGAAVAMVGMALIAAPVIRRGTSRPDAAEADDVHPPSQRDADEWVEQPYTPPNV
ncbi:MFS transporter [Demequina sp. NBRC 110056]|uniref:MFS transporter n=1 Tax=Demequina sp. NBRC 110056 TaxID=1570345 RepID=UPI000A000CCE|nr:MFS transporter [Demequina sp. NBRC 110056]